MSELTKFGFRKLGPDNYSTWRAQMRSLLATKDCEAALTTAEDPNSGKAKGFLIMCVTEKTIPLIERAASAKAAWDTLEALYQQQSTANIIRLRRELSTLEKKRDENITTYIARATAIVDQITSAGTQISEAEMAQALLAGLPPSYRLTKMIILNTDPFPNLTDITAKLLLEEAEKSVRGSDTAYSMRSGSNSPFWLLQAQGLRAASQERAEELWRTSQLQLQRPWPWSYQQQLQQPWTLQQPQHLCQQKQQQQW